MKSKFSLTLALFLVTAMVAGTANAQMTKTIRKAWPKSTVNALKVTNKFGEIKINDTGGDSVSIKVVITVDNSSASRARELINLIKVDFQKNGGLAIAETHIDEDFKSKQRFNINYEINIPRNRELDITNRYGSVVVNQLEGKGTFNVSYGNLSTGRINVPAGSPAVINISYGKADIEAVNHANMTFKYSQLSGGEFGQINLESKYSPHINLHKVNRLHLDSKYDNINIDEIGTLQSVSKYTSYKIGLLRENLNLDTGYGSLRINEVDSKFGNIKINNSYGGIHIGLNDLNYNLNADCSYCDVDYPSDRYKGDRIKENQSFSLDGSVGAGGGSVTIISRYGGVKLTE